MRPQTWFRFYNEVVDDPKVQRDISAIQFRTWANLLCLASKNSGKLPPFSDIAYKLRVSAHRAEAMTRELIEAGLFEEIDGQIVPHNWEGRQFKSDISTDRVKRFRNAARNVSETPDETLTTDHIRTDSPIVPKGTDPYSPEFEAFWATYPKHRRTAKGKAWDSWKKLKPSLELQLKISNALIAATRSHDWTRDRGQFVPMPATWLNQRRWDDESSQPATVLPLRPGLAL